jgi:hypothetical protein
MYDVNAATTNDKYTRVWSRYVTTVNRETQHIEGIHATTQAEKLAPNNYEEQISFQGAITTVRLRRTGSMRGLKDTTENAR